MRPNRKFLLIGLVVAVALFAVWQVVGVISLALVQMGLEVTRTQYWNQVEIAKQQAAELEPMLAKYYTDQPQNMRAFTQGLMAISQSYEYRNLEPTIQAARDLGELLDEMINVAPERQLDPGWINEMHDAREEISTAIRRGESLERLLKLFQAMRVVFLPAGLFFFEYEKNVNPGTGI